MGVGRLSVEGHGGVEALPAVLPQAIPLELPEGSGGRGAMAVERGGPRCPAELHVLFFTPPLCAQEQIQVGVLSP